MLRKKEVFTVVTPIPSFIPRQLALDILHAHSEVITLNPLVIGHHPISAPRNASADEFYSTWYEIEERIQYIPGAGKMGAGKISFYGCFHDMPWGLQTHIHAPMGIDLRNAYRICGNQPGEPPETREIGLEALGAPLDGLYLREDIEIKCNITMVSFVRAQLKTAGKEMVQRIIKKAELIDAGLLRTMFEDGKLKTVNPKDRSAANQDKTTRFVEAQQSQMVGSGSGSGSVSPQIDRRASVPPDYSPSRATPLYSAVSPPPLLLQQQPPPPPPQQQQQQQYQKQPQQYQHWENYQQHQQQQQQPQQQYTPYQNVYAPPPIPPKESGAVVELPGDYIWQPQTPVAAGPNRSTGAAEHYAPNQQNFSHASSHGSVVVGNTYSWQDVPSPLTTQGNR